MKLNTGISSAAAVLLLAAAAAGHAQTQTGAQATSAGAAAGTAQTERGTGTQREGTGVHRDTPRAGEAAGTTRVAGATLDKQGQRAQGQAQQGQMQGQGQQAQQGQMGQQAQRSGQQGAQAGQASQQDRQFITKAAQANLLEVEAGRLASTRAQDREVQQFGRMMTQDHGQATQQLQRIAQSKGVELPRQLDRDHQRKLERLQNARGEEFDREYAKLMVESHRESVENFQRTARQGGDPEIRSFAQQQLPTLQQHLAQAERLPGQDGRARTAAGQQGQQRDQDRDARQPGAQQQGTQRDMQRDTQQQRDVQGGQQQRDTQRGTQGAQQPSDLQRDTQQRQQSPSQPRN